MADVSQTQVKRTRQRGIFLLRALLLPLVTKCCTRFKDPCLCYDNAGKSVNVALNFVR